MRLFGSERIAGLVDKMGMKDDEALVSSMLSKSIERAQRKVEENHFGVRKRLLEYDDVMNYQREAIYSRRRNALSGEKVDIDLQNMMQDLATIIVEKNEGADFESFRTYLMSHLSIDADFDQEFYEKARPAELTNRLVESMKTVYDRRMAALVERVNPIIKKVYETQGQMYQNIAIPITDGRKMVQLSVNLEKAYNNECKELVMSLARSAILYQIDEHWKTHLRDMDDLRQSVQNVVYEQKDPLVVYKHESYNLFSTMLEELYQDVLSFLLRAVLALRDREPQPARQNMPRRTDLREMRTNDPSQLVTNGEQAARMPVKVEKKVGRNDPCPCGSGLKYKNCHGKGIV